MVNRIQKKKSNKKISKKVDIATLLKLKKSPLPFSFPTLIIEVTPTPIATIYVIDDKLKAIWFAA